MRSYYLQINEYLQRLIKSIITYDKKGIQLKGISLTIIELFILKSLGKHKEKKMFEIIQELNIDRNSFVTIINRLQHQQIIIKTKSLKDKRAYTISLTAKGEDIYNELLQKEEDILFSLLNDFSFNEEKAILKLLVKLDMLNKEKNQGSEAER